MSTDESHPTSGDRHFGWWDMFVSPEDDPRDDGAFANDERSMLVGYLRDRRLTFEMKCAGLDAAGMAQRSVPPSDLSLLGLVRHLADVERAWFRGQVAGLDVESRYGGSVHAFGDVVADPAMLDEAWTAWREEVTFAERLVAEAADLGMPGKGDGTPLRSVLLEAIVEYSRHAGHADLLRERVDGRVGQ